MESTASFILILLMGLQASSVIGDLSSVNGTDSPSKMLEALGFKRELNSQYRAPYGYYPSGNQTRNDDKENQGREEFGVNLDRKKRYANYRPSKKYLPQARVLEDKDGNLLHKWTTSSSMTWAIQGSLKEVPKADLLSIIRKALSLWEPLLPFTFDDRRADRKWGLSTALVFVFGSSTTVINDLIKADVFYSDRALEWIWVEEPSDDPRWKNKIFARALIPKKNPRYKYVTYRGLVHFDVAHSWTYQQVYDTAVHGIGHQLGLAHPHPDHNGAVMHPHYRTFSDVRLTRFWIDTDLTTSDLQSVEKIYGIRDGFPAAYRCEDTMRRKIRSVIRVHQNKVEDTYYYVFFDDKVKKLIYRDSPIRRVDEVFEGLPTNYDLVFTAWNSQFNSIFFVADHLLFQYNVEDLRLQNKVHNNGLFREFPKFAWNFQQPRGILTDAVLFGDKHWWRFAFNQTHPQTRPIPFRRPNVPNRFPNIDGGAKYAVSYHGDIYIASRNDSYYIWRRGKVVTKKGMGVPRWMETLMCPGLIPSAIGSGAESSKYQRMPRPSLVLVIMLSLIKLY